MLKPECIPPKHPTAFKLRTHTWTMDIQTQNISVLHTIASAVAQYEEAEVDLLTETGAIIDSWDEEGNLLTW